MRLSRTIAGKSFLANPLCRFASIAAVLGLILVSASVSFSGRTSSSVGSAAAVARARLGDSVTTGAAGRGKPWINMTDGHELVTSYKGSNELVGVLARDQARPLSLASGDFDEDGMPDLVTGYAVAEAGLVTLQRGNVDSVYPYTPEARQRKASGDFTNAPFLSPAAVFDTAAVPEILLQGDFNADGHADLIAVARGSETIHLLAGDGRGNLAPAQDISLPGKVTAVTSGEINRADGLTDLVVAIDGADGPKLMVFEGPEGAVKATPELLSLSSAATDLILAYVGADHAADVAVAAGNELVIFNGRDRKLSLDEKTKASVPQARISRRSFPSALISTAIGDFTGGPDLDLAVMLDDGSVQLISAVGGEGQLISSRLHSNAITLAAGLRTRGGQLFCARVSSLSHENLVMVDRESNQLHVWMDDEERRTRGDAAVELSSRQPSPPVTFDTEREPAAVLPMRLNTDALSDLVILRAGHAPPSVLTTQSNSPIVVCTTSDSCSNCDSLREAITRANNTAGLDTIQFNNQFSGTPTITLQGSLPSISEAIVIDGGAPGSCANQAESDVTVQSATRIGIDGGNFVNSGFNFTGGGNRIADFVIGRFTSNGLQVTNNAGNIVEGNFIGLASDGSTPRGNGTGLRITTRANTIGGTVSAARNTISSNSTGVMFDGVNANDNNLRLNFIGTDSTASVLRGNQLSGVLITNGASRNVIGGSIENTRNEIAGNRDGVMIASGSSNLIQRNFIELNTRDAVLINSAGNTVGGTTDITINGLWTSGSHGAEMSGSLATDNRVQGNYIGLNFVNGNPVDRGNTGNGVALTGNASRNAIGGASQAAGNFIALNSTNGVLIGSGNQNLILSNRIFNNVDLPIRLSPGANGDQAPPALVAASFRSPASEPTIAAVTLDVTVNFTGTPGQTFILDFFINSMCDCKGKNVICLLPLPLGQRSTGVIDSTGRVNLTYSFTLDQAPPAAYGFVNATATSSNNNTSQFSQCVQIAACSFAINPPTASVGAASGTGSFGVTAGSGCNWTATSNAPWLTTTSTGSGNGTANYSFQQNTSASSRTGVITVGNATHTVTQAPQPQGGPDFSLTITPGTFSGPIGTKAVIPVTINRTGGFTGEVTITPAPKGGGIKPKPPDPVTTTDSSVNFKYKITAAADPFSSRMLTFTGRDNAGRERTVTVTITALPEIPVPSGLRLSQRPMRR